MLMAIMLGWLALAFLMAALRFGRLQDIAA
jgi:hypothetical protein